MQGVYAGGVESASELVRRGDAAPQDFMLLSGYSGWGPWQLQQVRAVLRVLPWLEAGGDMLPQWLHSRCALVFNSYS